MFAANVLHVVTDITIVCVCSIWGLSSNTRPKVCEIRSTFGENTERISISGVSDSEKIDYISRGWIAEVLRYSFFSEREKDQ